MGRSWGSVRGFKDHFQVRPCPPPPIEWACSHAVRQDDCRSSLADDAFEFR